MKYGALQAAMQAMITQREDPDFDMLGGGADGCRLGGTQLQGPSTSMQRSGLPSIIPFIMWPICRRPPDPRRRHSAALEIMRASAAWGHAGLMQRSAYEQTSYPVRAYVCVVSQPTPSPF